jgi:acyl-CoA thioester hydrolase
MTEHHLSDFHLELPIQIRFNDIDGLGHINNAVYQEYFDLGRIQYLRQTLGNQLGTNDQNLVVVSYKTDFAKPLYLHDEISVLTRVYKLGEKSLRMMQWLVKKGEESPRVVCDAVMAGFMPTTEKSMVIPDIWRHAFNDFEKGVLIPDTNR